jgi:hypothetical protein
MNPSGTPESLSPEKVQMFVAALSGLPPEEVRKAKSLYVRNAISEYHAMLKSLRAFGCLQVVFAIIPIFWPILYAQRRMMNAQRHLFEASGTRSKSGKTTLAARPSTLVPNE